MIARCPGQDRRWRTAELHRCSNCGAEEEIWSDELKVRCSGCGAWIYKEEVPSCVHWCKAARECLGEERWKRLHGDEECEAAVNITAEGAKNAESRS